MLPSCDQERGEGGCSGSEDGQGCSQVQSCLSPRPPNPSAVFTLASRSVFPGSQTEREVWLDTVRSHLPPRGLKGGSCETAERKGSVRPVGRSRNTVWPSFQAEAGLPQKPHSISVLQLLEIPQCPFKHHPHLFPPTP